jgi:cytidine deaminase
VSAVIDWEALRAAAREVAERAHAPYSRLHVGAAALCADGRVLAACNVENASYGLTLCAECGIVSMLHALAPADSQSPRLVALSVVAGDGGPLAPCGRCRQLLLENGGPELLVDRGANAAPVRIGTLLPGAFDAGELERVED